MEAASLVAFAAVQHRLLGAGGLSAAGPPRWSGITLASQAITNSLPGGAAVAAVYGFRWYRRLGADDALAGWAMVGTAVAAALGLALVAAGGLALATEQGATLDLIPVVVGVLVATLAVGALFVYERPLGIVVNRTLRTCHRLTGRPRGDLEAHIEHVVDRVTVVRLHWRQIGPVVGWALGNWLLDCSCFALSLPHGGRRASPGRGCSSPTAPASSPPTSRSPRAGSARWRGASPSPSPTSGAPIPGPSTPCSSTA